MTENRKTAVYIRLSMEDGNVDGRTKLESDSVTSQRILLKSFVIDQLGVDEADILEYVDDGVSGHPFQTQWFSTAAGGYEKRTDRLCSCERFFQVWQGLSGSGILY